MYAGHAVCVCLARGNMSLATNVAGHILVDVRACTAVLARGHGTRVVVWGDRRRGLRGGRKTQAVVVAATVTLALAISIALAIVQFVVPKSRITPLLKACVLAAGRRRSGSSRGLLVIRCGRCARRRRG